MSHTLHIIRHPLSPQYVELSKVYSIFVLSKNLVNLYFRRKTWRGTRSNLGSVLSIHWLLWSWRKRPLCLMEITDSSTGKPWDNRSIHCLLWFRIKAVKIKKQGCALTQFLNFYKILLSPNSNWVFEKGSNEWFEFFETERTQVTYYLCPRTLINLTVSLGSLNVNLPIIVQLYIFLEWELSIRKSILFITHNWQEVGWLSSSVPFPYHNQVPVYKY